MDGLENQVAAAIDGIISQLYTNNTVQIKHSSRDSVILRVCEALLRSKCATDSDDVSDDNNGQQDEETYQSVETVVAKKLVFRSGVSVNGIQRLEEALQQSDTNIEELEFVCLKSIDIVERVIYCCRRNGIRRLSLKTFSGSTRSFREHQYAMLGAIRGGLVVSDCDRDDKDIENKSSRTTLEYLEIENYPIGDAIGEVGGHVLTNTSSIEGLKTLKLLDCDLRSDSAAAVAQIIRRSKNLEVLDLSYNRHFFLGSQLTRELSIKTLVQRGLVHNLSLTELHMCNYQRPRGLAATPTTINRSKIDQHLSVNIFVKKYQQQQGKEGQGRRKNPSSIQPAMWSELLSRVSAKPSALFLFLQDSVPVLFAG